MTLKAPTNLYKAPKLTKMPKMPNLSKLSVNPVKNTFRKVTKTPNFSALTKLNKPLKMKKLAVIKKAIKKNAGY